MKVIWWILPVKLLLKTHSFTRCSERILFLSLCGGFSVYWFVSVPQKWSKLKRLHPGLLPNAQQEFISRQFITSDKNCNTHEPHIYSGLMHVYFFPCVMILYLLLNYDCIINNISKKLWTPSLISDLDFNKLIFSEAAQFLVVWIVKLDEKKETNKCKNRAKNIAFSSAHEISTINIMWMGNFKMRITWKHKRLLLW